MRKIFLSIMIVFSVLTAQKQKNIIKIGCIDLQKVVDWVSADKAYLSLLQSKKNEYIEKAEKLSKEIQQMKDVLAVEGKNLPAERRSSIQQEILWKEEELKNFVKERESLLRQKEGDVETQLLREIYSTVKEIAIKNGYSMILEKSSAVVYSEEDLDITKLVIDALEASKKSAATK